MKACLTCNTPLNSVTTYTRPDGSIKYNYCRKCYSARQVARERKKNNWQPKQTTKAVLVAGVKRCSCCKETKPLDQFYWQKSSIRHSSYCAPCARVRYRLQAEKKRIARSWIVAGRGEFMGYF